MIDLARVAKALEYAIREADEWHDDRYGGPVESPEMDDARAVLLELKFNWQGKGIAVHDM